MVNHFSGGGATSAMAETLAKPCKLTIEKIV